MTLQDINLNPDKDSFIIIKFTGVQSAAFQIYPVNVSPMQMALAGKSLEWQAKSNVDMQYIKKVVEDLKKEEQPKIAVPEPGTVLRNAK